MGEPTAGRGYWVADVGGTSIRWAKVSGVGEIEDLEERETSAAHWQKAWFSAEQSGCRAAVIAVAGPVVEGAADLTNGALHFDEQQLTADLGRPVRVVNDLVAAAAGVGLTRSEAHLLRGEYAAGPYWVVGLGTGVGAALVLPGTDRSVVLAGEFGHSSLDSWHFSVASDASSLEGCEDRLSGDGFFAWAEAWQVEGRLALPAGVFASGADARRVLERPHHEWSALRIAYSRLLGVVLGDLATTLTVPGGVHVVGGFGQAILPHILSDDFETGFCAARRQRASVERVAVSFVAGNPALLGAAAIGQGRVTIGTDR